MVLERDLTNLPILEALFLINKYVFYRANSVIKNISDSNLKKCKNADVLIIDGQYILGKYIEDDTHLGGKELIRKIKKFDAKKVYLIAFSEHWYKMSAKDAEKQLPENFNIPDDNIVLEI
jgi:ribonuclease BN (tRNA processing enzyme)